MKNMKKLIALLVAVVMVFAMTTVASAETYQYELYQIFTGDYSGDVLTNVKWGANGTGTVGEVVPNDVLNALTSVNNASTDSAKLEVILKYANLETPVEATPDVSDDGKTVTYTGLADGYYLVKDADDSLANKEDEAYTLYMVEVVDGTLEVTRKADIPTVDKVIVENETEVKVNEASIGDTVNYEVTGTLPSNYDEYTTYQYIFTDTMVGLNPVDVNRDDKPDVTVGYRTKGSNAAVTAIDAANYTVAYNATTNSFTVTFTDLKAVTAITAADEIVVAYAATVSEGANIGNDPNTNTVNLEYSNDPNWGDEPGNPSGDEPTGITPNKTVETYVTEITILKVDGATENPLAGAEFTLTTEDGAKIALVTTEEFTVADNGEYYKLTNGTYTKTAPTEATKGSYAEYAGENGANTPKYALTTSVVAKGDGKAETTIVGTVANDTGLLTFTGLGAGTYTLSETKIPEGYNKIDDITFKVGFNATDKVFTSDNAKVVVGEDNMLDITIENNKGNSLPSTGGIGTTIFYVVGGLLVVGALIVLVSKKRMSKEA